MSRRDGLVASVLALVTVALLLPMAPIGVDSHHDGIMLKPAMDVRSGQVLFRDSFTQYGAITTYVQALTLALQPSLLALRLVTVGVYALSLLCLYAAWRLVLPRGLAAVAGGFFILFIPAYEQEPWNFQYWMLLPWSSAFAMLFQAVGLYALFRVIRGEQPERWGLVLGLACAAVFWCRQPVGVLMAGSLVAIWPALHWTGWVPAQSSKRVILGRILAGFAAVHALLLGHIALSGALPEWWYQNIVWPVRLKDAVVWKDTLFPASNPAAAAGLVALALALALPGLVRHYRPGLPRAWVVFYWVALAGVLAWQHAWLGRTLAMQGRGWNVVLPLVVIGLAVGSIVKAWRRGGVARSTEYYLSAAWAALGLASLMQYYPMGDVWHMFYALAPVFGLFVFAVWRWSGHPAPVVAAVLAIALVPTAWFRIQSMPAALNRPLVTLTKPALLRGMKVPPEQARDLDQIADTLALVERFRPDIPGVLIGNDALYLCYLRNKANPIPYFVTWRGLAGQANNLRRWDYIHRVRPVLILEKPRWEAVDEFYQREKYVPLHYVQAEFLEIAVPQELADAMGVKLYGIFGIGRPRSKVAP